MSDLAAFLLARVAEDEAVAREIADEMVRVASQYIPGAAPDPDDGGLYASEDGRNTPAVIVGPARVLAECESKRRIVELHVSTSPSDDGGTECDQCSFHEAYEGFNDYSEPAPCMTLRILAQPYADHPDYDPAWRL